MSWANDCLNKNAIGTDMFLKNVKISKLFVEPKYSETVNIKVLNLFETFQEVCFVIKCIADI